MYNLYLESCGRSKVVRLTPLKSATAKSIPNSSRRDVHLLCAYTESQTELFKIKADNYLTTISKTADDRTVRLEKIDYVEGRLVLNFVDSTGQKPVQPTFPEQDSFEFVFTDKAKNSITINKKNLQFGDTDKIEVEFRYGSYSALVRILCIPASQIYDVVLDFGSEATQMLIRRNDDDSRIEQHKIFNGVLRHFYNISSVKNERVYDQQDEDITLFRSIFFKKKRGEMENDFLYLPPSKDDSFFNFISSRRDSRGERIPNVKIAYLAGRNVEGTTKEHLHRGIILRFLHEAIMSVAEEEAALGRNCEIAIRVTLLLPNVLPQKSTSDLLRDLRYKANSTSFKKHIATNINLTAIDFRSCSESDASFLDWMMSTDRKKRNITPGKRYLIVDVGKGTTDFSIVKVSDVHNVISEFRAGFVGAGNAISYAIFQNYMRRLGGNRTEELIQAMLSAEPALLYDLENVIEEYKHHWRNDVQNVSDTNDIKVMKPEVILDRIKEMGQIGDPYHYVEDMAKRIANNIIDRLPLNMEIDYLVFSGRAFKFAMLKEQIEITLKEKKGAIKKIDYDESRAKCGCLYGPLNGINISLDSQMVGFPEIYDATIQTEPTEVNEKTEAYKEHKYYDVYSKTKSKVAGLAKIFQFFVDSTPNPIKNRVALNLDNEIRLYMTTGHPEDNINNDCVINISGNLYKPDSGDINPENAPYNIYFDGENFYLRHEKGCVLLNVVPMGPEKALLAESMFPYSLTD